MSCLILWWMPKQVCNFTWFGGRSPAVLIDGVKNFVIEDNDLYSAWCVRTTQAHHRQKQHALRARR